MKAVCLAAVLLVLAGCAFQDFAAYRAEPRSYGNPALLNCASGQVPICNTQGGRTRKYYSNCQCR